jgi:hypothetical protein
MKMSTRKLAIHRSAAIKLRSWRGKALWSAYLAINNAYTKIFSKELRNPYELSRLKDLRTSFENILFSSPGLAVLSREKNYFLLHASYGDKWNVLSFLEEHFSIYPNSLVVARHQDRELIQIFLGQDRTAERFIFIDQDLLNHLSSYFRPVSMLSMPLADTWCTEGCKHTITPYFINHGLPPSSFRHLHLVYYPYFNELYNLHGVSYGKLLRLILYLPATSKSRQPSFYSDQDVRSAEAISRCANSNSSSPFLPAVLFNVVNFSQAPLSTTQISLVTSTLEKNGYRVLLNVTQSASSEELETLVASHHSESVLVSIPPTLLALVCENVHAVIGVLGGAMNVAVQFSSAHVLSLQTPSVGTGCSEDELLGEWGKERIWEWVDQDWPCLHPGRVVVNKFIGDPTTITVKTLSETVQSFLHELPKPI